MKRLAIYLMVVCLALTLVSCDVGDEADIQNKDTQQTSAEDITGEDTTGEEKNSWSPEEVTVSDPDGDDDLTSSAGIISEGRIYIVQGEVLLVSGKNSPMWLYPTVDNMMDGFTTGDLVRVNHGMMMESYPMQTYVSQIALLEDGDVSDITDEMWSKIDGFIVDAPRE